MALTVTAITPTGGITSGQTFITIDGTDFEIDPLVGLMEITFGTLLATNIRVLTSTKLTCKTPKSIGTPGLVSVKVKNLDTSEEVIVPSAYTYSRPDLAVSTHLRQTVRTIVEEFKNQVLENVSLTSNTDYDRITGDGLNITELAKLPALLIIGPSIPENFILRTNVKTIVKSGSIFTVHSPPNTVDLEFNLVGVDDHPERILNLLFECKRFFQKNEFLEVLRDPLDIGKGTLKYQLDADSEGFAHNTRANQFNVHSFETSFTIRGFLFEDGEVIQEDFEIAQEILTTEQITP